MNVYMYLFFASTCSDPVPSTVFRASALLEVENFLDSWLRTLLTEGKAADIMHWFLHNC